MTGEIIGIQVNIVEVIKGALRIDTCHLTWPEVGISMIMEELGEAEERVHLEIEIGLPI